MVGMAWTPLSVLALPDPLTAFCHDEEPSREHYYLNGRCTAPCDFSPAAKSIHFKVTRRAEPTHFTVWYGEKYWGAGRLDLSVSTVFPNDLINIDYGMMTLGPPHCVARQVARSPEPSSSPDDRTG